MSHILLIQPPITKERVSPIYKLIRPERQSFKKEFLTRYFTNLEPEWLKLYTEYLDEWGNLPTYKYGLLQIASLLKIHGHEVKYLNLDVCAKKNFNLNYGNTKFKEFLETHLNDIEIIGTSCKTPEFPYAKKILNFCKQLNPNLITVIGGPHVTFMDTEVLLESCFDVVVRGEGEISMLELCDSIKRDRNFENIRGITYKKKRRIFRNKDRPCLSEQELNKLPLPAFELLPKEKYLFYSMVSRGCPYNCLYCAEPHLFGNSVRKRNVAKVIEELRILKDFLNAKIIHFCDDVFPQERQYITEFCNRLKNENPQMFFTCNIRVDNLENFELIEKLAHNRFIEFSVGIESGSDKILKEMKRKKFIFVLKALKKIKKITKSLICGFFMFGHPGENHDTAKETLEKIDYLLKEDLLFDVYSKCFIPYPGTLPFHKPKDFGINILTYNWERYLRRNYPLVYRLDDLNGSEIYNYWLMSEVIKLKNFYRRIARD